MSKSGATSEVAEAKGAGMAAAVAIADDDTPVSISWRSVIRWAFYVVGTAPGWVALQTALSIAVVVLMQYSVQVLATALSALSTASQPGDGTAPAAGGPGDGGLLSALLPSDATTAAFLFVFLTAAVIVLNYLDRILFSWTENLMVGRLRQNVHDKVLTLGPSFHEKFVAGRATLLVTSFVNIAQFVLKEIVTGPITRLIPMITALGFLVHNLQTLQSQDLAIQLILLAGLVVLPVIAWFLAARLQIYFARARESQEELAEEFMNSLHRPNEIQLMAAGPQRAAAFARRVREQIRAQVAATMRHHFANQFQDAIPRVLQAAIVFYGVTVALQSGVPGAAGAILALFYFVPQVTGPIQDLLTFTASFSSAWPQVQTVIEVLEQEPEGGERDGTLELGRDDRSITFRDVTFAYAPDRPKILNGVSHVFAPGTVTAIVARYGTGKSTVLNLIARLRRPQSGTILVGNKDLRDVKGDSLRRNVVKVSQFPLLISDTARENFRLAKAGATDAEIEAVCRRTGLWDVFVKETPTGSDPLAYRVSRQDDVGLTGGQRRVFAVTRALLLEPKVLLLDEPTTGVDPIGRQEMYETLAKACAGLTVIVVDQDMNFVANFADQVCCLEGAKFADTGSPEELLKRPSLFARLSEASTRAKRSTKVPAAVSSAVDRSRVPVAKREMPAAEVEGQLMRGQPVLCPQDHLVWLPEGSNHTGYFTCEQCGTLFRV